MTTCQYRDIGTTYACAIIVIHVQVAEKMYSTQVNPSKIKVQVCTYLT